MKAPLVRDARRLCFLLAVLAVSGCSSFERDWRAARATPARDPFGGPWEGRWTSAIHGQPAKRAGGRLRCIFTPLEAQRYRADFKANWMAFASSYRVVFRTERQGRILRFRGGQDLGALFGGVYRYEGRITPERFVASYDSSYDQGRFELTRP